MYCIAVVDPGGKHEHMRHTQDIDSTLLDLHVMMTHWLTSPAHPPPGLRNMRQHPQNTYPADLALHYCTLHVIAMTNWTLKWQNEPSKVALEMSSMNDILTG